MSWILALILRPFAALILFGLVCLPARLAVQKMPDTKVKRVLLLRVGDGWGGKHGSGGATGEKLSDAIRRLLSNQR